MVVFDLRIFAAIIAVYTMVVISPGPNFVLVTRYSLRARRGLAFAVTFGLAIGATINASLTMFGIGGLIAASSLFGLVVSILGGGFLIYLGYGALLAAFRERREAIAFGETAAPSLGDVVAVSSGQERADTLLAAVQKGMLVNLLNPKGIAFFIGLYAPLIARTDITTKLAVLATSFMIELVWYGAVILVLARPRFRRMYASARFSIDAIMGVLFILIGVSILAEALSYREAG